MAKILCSEPGCMNLRIDEHNSKCRYHARLYMRKWRAEKKSQDLLSLYITKPKRNSSKNA